MSENERTVYGIGIKTDTSPPRWVITASAPGQRPSTSKTSWATPEEAVRAGINQGIEFSGNMATQVLRRMSDDGASPAALRERAKGGE